MILIEKLKHHIIDNERSEIKNVMIQISNLQITT
jgi:hypothetical protein